MFVLLHLAQVMSSLITHSFPRSLGRPWHRHVNVFLSIPWQLSSKAKRTKERRRDKDLFAVLWSPVVIVEALNALRQQKNSCSFWNEIRMNFPQSKGLHVYFKTLQMWKNIRSIVMLKCILNTSALAHPETTSHWMCAIAFSLPRGDNEWRRIFIISLCGTNQKGQGCSSARSFG